VNAHLFIHIFTMFTNLRYLNFGPSSIWYQGLSFHIPPPAVISSTLLELHVCVKHFIDCLYLLDGRFSQLRILYVNITFIMTSSLIINNKVDYFELVSNLFNEINNIFFSRKNFLI
jgi:hypothetical protein